MSTPRDFLRVVPSLISSLLRMWQGTAVIKQNIGKTQDGALLKLYDMEGCAYCRLVREALTELDLDAHIVPVAPGDESNRAELKALGGKVQMPYLLDTNTNTGMYESIDIVNYLYQEYGNGRKRGAFGKMFTEITSILTSVSRGGRGTRFSPAANREQKPEKLLELYSFESSPFSRPVREQLSELGIPYILRNLGTTKYYQSVSGTKREKFNDRYGKVQVPYLIDSNTGQEMFDTWDIIEYLEQTYTVA